MTSTEEYMRLILCAFESWSLSGDKTDVFYSHLNVFAAFILTQEMRHIEFIMYHHDLILCVLKIPGTK